MVKQIIFITYGDSQNASSWSNIPYLFSKALEDKGFQLIRLDINPDPKSNVSWNKYIDRYLHVFYKDHKYSYIRSWFFRYKTFKKIKKVVRENPDAYFCVFLNFEFYNKFSKVPSLLFGDWTYDMIITDRLHRKPYFFEKWFINYQRTAIQQSQLVISMFKDLADLISFRYHKEVRHLGLNVINDLNYNPVSDEIILEEKKKSNKILFIGTPKYLVGAKKLIEAFMILQKNSPSLQLHIIGITKDDLHFDNIPNLYFYGYLKKDDDIDNKVYYDLLVSAKVLVNPSDGWAGYSSSIEAMKYFTPVIIKPYNSFTSDFGMTPDFGYYLENLETETIVSAIHTVIYSEDYSKLCFNAHHKVKDFTWDNYVSVITELMEKVPRES